MRKNVSKTLKLSEKVEEKILDFNQNILKQLNSSGNFTHTEIEQLIDEYDGLCEEKSGD